MWGRRDRARRGYRTDPGLTVISALTTQRGEADVTPSAGGDSLLSLTGIVKRWGSLEVLSGADLELEAGTQSWIGGRNGVGKTTLLRIAAGLIAPDSGGVALDGTDPVRSRRSFQRQMGFLSAGNSGLYARLNVRENLVFGAAVSFIRGRDRAAIIDGTLERFGLGDLASRRVDRLSMGQRQRVRLALAFLHGPRVVLLDEPHTSLDDEALEVLYAAVQQHVEAGGAALLCSPSRAVLDIEVDNAWVLDAGRLVAA